MVFFCFGIFHFKIDFAKFVYGIELLAEQSLNLTAHFRKLAFLDAEGISDALCQL